MPGTAATQTLGNFKGEDVDDYVRFAVEKHDVATDEHVRAVGRGWRQTPLQFLGAGVHTLFETRGKRTAYD